MGKKVRVRCPLCGMLVWQSRLNKDFDLEFVLQKSSGRGYQKIQHEYERMLVPDDDGVKLFCTVLALKMAEKAKKIIKSMGIGDYIEINIILDEELLGEEVEAVERDDVEDEDDKERWEPETTTYEVEFDNAVYDVEVPIVVEGGLKKRSLLGRLFHRGDGQTIKEMEEIVPDLDLEFELDSSYEFESVDSDYEIEGRV